MLGEELGGRLRAITEVKGRVQLPSPSPCCWLGLIANLRANKITCNKMAGSIVGVSLALAVSAGGWCNYTNMNDAIDSLNTSQVTPSIPPPEYTHSPAK